jgi:hypothetical protein
MRRFYVLLTLKGEGMDKYLIRLLNKAYDELLDDNYDHDVVVGLVAEAKAIVEKDQSSFDKRSAI